MPPSAPKRPRASSPHISAPTRVLAKRPRRGPPPRSVAALRAAWASLSQAIDAALHDVRLPALAAVKAALAALPPGGHVTAVTLTMGASSAAGDRAASFRAVLRHLADAPAAVLHLSSAHHATAPAALDAVRAVPPPRPVVVALEDADRVPDAVLRDLVYFCGKRRAAAAAHSPAAASVPPVALLFGTGGDAHHVRAALGVEEAGMVAHATVHMPHAAACFDAVVRRVLAPRPAVLLSRRVFELVEREFFHGEHTIAMLTRALRQICTLHFFRQPLAHVFCAAHAEADVERVRAALTPQVLDDIRNNVCSVATMKDRPFSNEDLRNQCVTWYRRLAKWKARCQLLEDMFLRLFDTCEVRETEWRDGAAANHSLLRLHIFRTFLVESNDCPTIAAGRYTSLILARIKKGGRAQLRNIADTMNQVLKSSPLHEDDDERNLISRLDNFENFLSETAKKDEETSKVEANEEQRPRRMARGAGAARQRRMQALLQVDTAKAKKTSVLQTMRSRLSAIFEDLLQLVGPLNDIPMYEVILFGGASDLRKYSGGMGGSAEPRSSLFTAMRKPSCLLGVLDTIPDTAVAYKILAEGGRMVSLYDWYNSFAATITAGKTRQDEDGNVTVDPINAAEMQARFAKGCSELEFLGVLKYTNRKTDHVMRLAYE